MKFHIFQAPPGSSSSPVYHKVTMYLTPLTENLYFSIYLNRTGYEYNAVNEFSTLKYPSVQSYSLGFLSNPIKDVDQDLASYTYTFYGKSESKYTYYTCAFYQQNWGLTNILKAEYQLRIETDIVSQNEGEQQISNQIKNGIQTEPTVSPTAGAIAGSTTVSSSDTTSASSGDDLWHFNQVGDEFIQ